MVAHEGLDGVVALESDVSSVVDGVLRYRGYSIDDLAANVSFEECAYLLDHDDLPTSVQLAAFHRELDAEWGVPAGVIQGLHVLPTSVVPMAAMRTAVSLLGHFDPDAESMTPDANRRKAVRLLAKAGPLIGAIDRIRKGLEPVPAQAGQSIAWNFLWCLFGKEPGATAVKSIDLALVLHAEHELSASTFCARMAASTLADLHSAIVAAIGALKGRLHGGANEQVMEMLASIGPDGDVDAWLRAALERQDRIMGFGHRVHKTGDPRTRWLRETADRLTKGTPGESHLRTSERLERAMAAQRRILPNVDLYAATTYAALGIPTDLFPLVFVLARMPGWCAHVLEQYRDNRLIHPRARYVGASDRAVVPIDRRT